LSGVEKPQFVTDNEREPSSKLPDVRMDLLCFAFATKMQKIWHHFFLSTINFEVAIFSLLTDRVTF
jgi:hypothetical protein